MLAVSPLSQEGYWGKVTSSVDFCESNYSLSPFVAEPANSLSSFIYVFHGLIGYMVVNRLRGEKYPYKVWGDRLFTFMYLGVVVAGFGSVLLHGTLLSVAQAADELPMLIISMSLITSLLERKSTDKLTYPWVLPLFGVCSLTIIIIYLSFQQLYFVFVGMYALNISIIVFWTGSIALRKRLEVHNEDIRKQVIFPLWVTAVFSFVFCGLFAWVTDFVLCEEISALGWLAPMVLHPVWHFGTSFGAYLAIQIIAASRGELLQLNPTIRWLFWGLPYVMYDGSNKKN